MPPPNLIACPLRPPTFPTDKCRAGPGIAWAFAATCRTPNRGGRDVQEKLFSRRRWDHHLSHVAVAVAARGRPSSYAAFYNITSMSSDGRSVVIRTTDLPDPGRRFWQEQRQLRSV